MGLMKTFVHPHEVYQLQYPAEWEQLEQDEARSCGFGPKERDNVGLWVSIMPFSVDTERLTEDLPRMMNDCLKESEATNVRKDLSLRHTGMKADMTKDGQGGHYWIVTGGDVVLFASTQVPVAEREAWNPVFDKVMSSLQITRDDELVYRKIASDVLKGLRQKYPDEDFEFDEKGIRGKHQVINLNNVYREVKASPKRQQSIIANFIDGLAMSAEAGLGTEEWDDVRGQILPVLKPTDYIVPGTSTQHLHVSEWLADVVITYVIKSKKFYRFLTGWDLRRWDITGEQLHEQAVQNLVRADWPKRMEGSRQRDGGRVIIIDTTDGLASSRLLHPELHQLLSGPLGSPFYAGIPNRSTLVVFSNRRSLKQRITRTLRKDHHGSAYPITASPFLVTADGIAPVAE